MDANGCNRKLSDYLIKYAIRATPKARSINCIAMSFDSFEPTSQLESFSPLESFPLAALI